MLGQKVIMDDVSGGDLDYANSTLSFPHKLFILLESGDYHELIHWVEHGMCFRIEDAEKFADIVIPKYFKRKSYSVILF